MTDKISRNLIFYYKNRVIDWDIELDYNQFYS